LTVARKDKAPAEMLLGRFVGERVRRFLALIRILESGE
jgi:hypothetical protein